MKKDRQGNYPGDPLTWSAAGSCWARETDGA